MMATLPESVQAVAKAAAEKYPNDIDKALKEGLKRAHALPDFSASIDMMIAHSMRVMIKDARHIHNVALRKASGVYGQGPRVSAADSEVAFAIYDEIIGYHIFGRTLGDLNGDEIPGIIVSERARANGHLFNADLLTALEPLVPAGKTVGKAVPKRKLEAIWNSLRP